MADRRFGLVRPLIYLGGFVVALGVVAASAWDSSWLGATLIGCRQLFGLWSLAFLLGSITLGPLTSVVPRIPFKSELMYGRRAVGVCAAIFAVLHVACYAWSLLLRDWREIYTPGALWVAGLIIGLVAMVDLMVLALTSRDASVKRMGGRKWKQLHRTVYAALVLTLIHSWLVGADFGWQQAPDLKSEPDAGAGISFLVLSLVWLALFVARSRQWRWMPGGKGAPGEPG